MTEPTAQELRLARALHSADNMVFCYWDSRGSGFDCAGPDDDAHKEQARALIALGVRVLDVDWLAQAVAKAVGAADIDDFGIVAYRGRRGYSPYGLAVRIAEHAALAERVQDDNPQSRTLDTADLDWRDAR